MDWPTVSKALLALLPSTWIVARQTTMISASITAYSTAVGPSSALMNSTARATKFFNMGNLLQKRVKRMTRPQAKRSHASRGKGNRFEVHTVAIRHPVPLPQRQSFQE